MLIIIECNHLGVWCFDAQLEALCVFWRLYPANAANIIFIMIFSSTHSLLSFILTCTCRPPVLCRHCSVGLVGGRLVWSSWRSTLACRSLKINRATWKLENKQTQHKTKQINRQFYKQSDGNFEKIPDNWIKTRLWRVLATWPVIQVLYSGFFLTTHTLLGNFITRPSSEY